MLGGFLEGLSLPPSLGLTRSVCVEPDLPGCQPAAVLTRRLGAAAHQAAAGDDGGADRLDPGDTKRGAAERRAARLVARLPLLRRLRCRAGVRRAPPSSPRASSLLGSMHTPLASNNAHQQASRQTKVLRALDRARLKSTQMAEASRGPKCRTVAVMRGCDEAAVFRLRRPSDDPAAAPER